MKTRIFLSLFFFAAFALQVYADDPDLLIYLPMDSVDGDQVADASGNGHDGTIVADANLVDGKYGKGLEFSAAAEIQIQDDEGMDGIQAMTVAVWV